MTAADLPSTADLSRTHLDPAYFDTVADRYDAVRPTYPDELYDALRLRPGLRVLEIGPGTGQASRALAARGVELTCYETGAAMAARTAAAVPAATVVHAPAAEASGTYDLVCGFTSLHWLGDDLWPLAHRLLAPGGRLAYVGTAQISDEAGDEVFQATLPLYRRHFGVPDHALPRIGEVVALPYSPAGLFALAQLTVIPRQRSMDGREYAELVSMYSPTGTLPEPQRSEFLAELAAIVDGCGGIVQHTANVLHLFTRR